MGYFRKCPDCGCNLDPNETCDCQNNKKEVENNDKATENSNNEKAQKTA